MIRETRFLDTAAAGIEIRINADGSKTAAGYAAVYYDPANPGTEFALRADLVERIAPGAFDAALQTDDVRALFNHDTAAVLGRTGAGTLRLAADARGLRYEIDLPDTTAGRDLAVSLQRGDITGSSFGFAVKPDGQSVARDGNKSVRTLTRIERLYDVGPVTFPAYTATAGNTRDDGMIDAGLAAQAAAALAAESRRVAMQRRARAVEISGETV